MHDAGPVASLPPAPFYFTRRGLGVTRILTILALAAATTLVAAARQSPTCDLLISGGRIVDGTGAPWFVADVCVAGGRIASVRDRDTSTATRRIDARGLVVSPGFIDMLGQSEYWVLRDSRVGSKIMQGITTELTGEASFSSAAHDRARQLHPFAAMFDKEGVPSWTNLSGYLAVLDQQPATINLGTFISAGGVWDSVVGRDDRAATAAELTAMEAQVAAAMQAGAFGVSTSLQYVPDRFARTEELVAMARVAGRYGGSYISHQRSEADAIDESLDEVFRIAREAGVPAIVHHLKTAYTQNWGRMPAVLQRFDRARMEGLDVAADLYPYTAGSNPLDASLPVWVREGGRAAMVKRLLGPATRARIKAEILQPSTTWENQYLGSGGAAGILVSAVGRAELKAYQGRTLDDIAKAEQKDPLDVLIDLIAKDDTTGSGIMFFINEADMRAALAHQCDAGHRLGRHGARQRPPHGGRAPARVGIGRPHPRHLRARGAAVDARERGAQDDVAARAAHAAVGPRRGASRRGRRPGGVRPGHDSRPGHVPAAASVRRGRALRDGKRAARGGRRADHGRAPR